MATFFDYAGYVVPTLELVMSITNPVDGDIPVYNGTSHSWDASQLSVGDIAGLSADLASKVDLTQIDAANGVAGLDSSSKLENSVLYTVNGVSGNSITHNYSLTSDNIPAGSTNKYLPTNVSKGNIIAADGSSFNVLSVGANGLILQADNTQSDGIKWGSVSGTVPASSSLGDLLAGDGSGGFGIQSTSTDGYLLTCNSTQPLGLQYVDPTQYQNIEYYNYPPSTFTLATLYSPTIPGTLSVDTDNNPVCVLSGITQSGFAIQQFTIDSAFGVIFIFCPVAVTAIGGSVALQIVARSITTGATFSSPLPLGMIDTSGTTITTFGTSIDYNSFSPPLDTSSFYRFEIIRPVDVSNSGNLYVYDIEFILF